MKKNKINSFALAGCASVLLYLSLGQLIPKTSLLGIIGVSLSFAFALVSIIVAILDNKTPEEEKQKQN